MCGYMCVRVQGHQMTQTTSICIHTSIRWVSRVLTFLIALLHISLSFAHDAFYHRSFGAGKKKKKREILMPVNPDCIVKTSIRLTRVIKLQLCKVYKWSQGGYSGRGETWTALWGQGLTIPFHVGCLLSLNLSVTRVDTACPNTTELLGMRESLGIIIPGILICMQCILRCPVRKL